MNNFEEDIKYSHESSFQISLKLPTIKEKEELDENKVIETIKNLNLNFQLNLIHKNDILKQYQSEIEGLQKCFYAVQDEEATKLINQNFTPTNKVLKFLVLGSQGVGKTTFIKKLSKNFVSSENFYESTSPTEW